jgi:probable rRNA maturation factor
MSNIAFIVEDIEFTLKGKKDTKKWLTNAAISEQREIDSLSYIFCSDDFQLNINKEYLDHDYYTDIITFDNSLKSDSIMGDVFISIERVKENAIQYGVTFEQELNRVMVHGLLHLCGYTDKLHDDKILMRLKENTYISLR